MNRKQVCVVLVAIVLLVAGIVLAVAVCGCSRPLVPRHDAPFDTLPPEHIKALEESRKAGR